MGRLSGLASLSSSVELFLASSPFLYRLHDATLTLSQSSRYEGKQDMAGTIAYTTPEQMQGKPRLASDQYALGIVVYEWLCGERPFHGSFNEIATQHVLTPPPSLREKVPELSPGVEQVVMTALAKDPKARFATIHAFAYTLEQAQLAEQALSSAPTILATPKKPASTTQPAPEVAPASSLSERTKQQSCQPNH